MLRPTFRRSFSHIVRTVDPRGFIGDYRQLHHVHSASTQRKVAAALQHGSNVLFCGHHHTGKLTLLKAIGEYCASKLGLRVAYVSADNVRANRMDGYLLHHFIGLRISRDELPSQEQLEGTLERHVRLVESTYASCLPSLCNTDVLLLDSMEKVEPVVLLSMDAVSRRQRGRPREPFGGLRVFAAADFWRLPVHPCSDTGGYLFQLPQWGELFPRQELLRTTHGQDKRLNRFTVKALFGDLTTQDIQELEALSMEGKPETSLPSRSPLASSLSSLSSLSTPLTDWKGVGRSDRIEAAEEQDDDEENEELGERAVESSPRAVMSMARADAAVGEDEVEDDDEKTEPLSSRSTAGATVLFDDSISNAEAVTQFNPRFPKQPTVRVMPTRFRVLKQTEMGSFLVNLLVQSSMPVSFGLVEALSVEVGSRVHLLMNGQASIGVPAGAVGEVLNVGEHYLTVHFPEAHRTVDVPRMRATCYHPDYPEVKFEVQQFPLFPRNRLCPMAILSHANGFHVHLNGRRMADTNDLGNVLAHMRSFDDFTLRNTADFAHLDGMVHEPTRIYYHHILQQPLSAAPEQWCRNCKAFVASDTFFDHWASCVRSVRWCNECNRTVPLELLEPHREKHQVVLCMDCGQAVEWRHWEAHRLSCSAMMREVSPDNVFLPLRTRQLALELGLDKRDLHTMRAFSKSMLPKVRQEIH